MTSFIVKRLVIPRGHPHSTYGQRGGGGGVKPNTYDYVLGGRRVFKVAYVRKKNFLDHKIPKLFFFCTKEAITLPFIIVYRKVQIGLKL